ncbi:MAG: hypothetical protein OXQ29_27350 [Rhodospirillaceae bacterium]|nr:hypothetical protein [Rhodospirillaceae bacterium]
MLTRRDLMKSAGLAMAVGAVPVSVAARTNDLRGWVVLADPKFEESLSFAADLSARGATVVEFSGRTDELWYGTLRDACTEGVRPVVAGVVDRQRAFELGMFCENALYFAAQQDFVPVSSNSLESFVLAPMNSRRVVRL